MAPGGARRRGLPDGLHARTGALRRADCRRPGRQGRDARSGPASAPTGSPPAQTIENIETARRLGAAGVVLFSYDSLIDPRQSSPDYIAVVGRSVFAKPAAASTGTR